MSDFFQLRGQDLGLVTGKQARILVSSGQWFTGLITEVHTTHIDMQVERGAHGPCRQRIVVASISVVETVY